ncbi:MAG: hypothetical protein HY317_03015 [Acidobacteria bacterium]|nr:hypothetical protein [Acidobacteriota bacterium]
MRRRWGTLLPLAGAQAALVNVRGELIGIDTAICSESRKREVRVPVEEARPDA